MADDPLKLSPEDVTVVVKALEDAMFFRDARSRIPKMSAESKQRDRDRVSEYEALARRLRSAAPS